MEQKDTQGITEVENNYNFIMSSECRKDPCSDPEIKLHKTWSSVSNSSLIKTFALCQFRKQKLCLIPPNIVLGLKKI